MKLNNIGAVYRKDGEVFTHISYCSYPTAILKNVLTGEILHIVPNSKQGEEFKELKEEVSECQ